MKIRLSSLKIKNIRNYEDLELMFDHKKVTMVMMPNGTGKTTIINLIKFALCGNLDEKKLIREYKPSFLTEAESEVNLRISIDNLQFKISMKFDFKELSVLYYYTDTIKGHDVTRPEEFSVFSEEFVEKFIFDGELAKEFLNNDSAYAEESVMNIYHLEKLEKMVEKIKAVRNSLLLESADTTASNDKGYNRHLNKLQEFELQEQVLISNSNSLKSQISEFTIQIKEKQQAIDDIYMKHKSVQESIERNNALIYEKKMNLNEKLRKVSSDILFVHNLSDQIWKENCKLIDTLVKLKLPKNMSEQFFMDLISESSNCICGRELGDIEREYIKSHYHVYMDENNISVLNELKSHVLSINKQTEIEADLFDIKEIEKEIKKIEQKIKRAQNLIDVDEQKQRNELESANEILIKRLHDVEKKYTIITCEEELYIDTLKITENLKKIRTEILRLRKVVEQVESNLKINKNADILVKIFEEAKVSLLEQVKYNVLNETNNKVKKIIKNDHVVVDSIDKYVKIKNKSGVSMGQSLSVAYAFISALFDSSFYDLPFVIDSPAGSLDYEYRSEVAKIIPSAFDQLIMFVISSEKKFFTDIIGLNNFNEIQYYTVYRENDKIRTDESSITFNAFQEGIVEYV